MVNKLLQSQQNWILVGSSEEATVKQQEMQYQQVAL
jgi:hypothetical protein